MNSKEYLELDEKRQTDFIAPLSGLATLGHAVARLKRAEQQFDNGQWMTGEEFFARTRNMIDHYAS